MGDTCSKTCGKNVNNDDIDLDYFTTYAVCILYPSNQSNIKAVAKLQQKFNSKNLPSGDYDVHLHEFGNLQQGIKSAGQTFNPPSNPTSKPLGQLGTVEQTKDNQPIQLKLEFNDIMLSGQDTVIGRSIIIKSKSNDSSLAEGVIGISQSFQIN